MAAGNKNYFRHNFRAHEDENIQALMHEFGGVHGYFAYFVLTERCAELLSNGQDFPLTFHEASLRKSLKLSKKKLRSFLELSKKFLNISSEVSENFIKISHPNLLKFFGNYPKKGPKEKKRKEKESKVKEKINKKENSGDFLFSGVAKNCRDLISFWNDKKLFKQNLAPYALEKISEGLDKKLGFYSIEEIKQAVDNYAKVFHSDKFKIHKYALYEFLNSDKTYKFFPGEFDTERFVQNNLSPVDREAAALEKMKDDMRKARIARGQE